jgi:transglutaminase-like putative cysteine protease
MGFGAWFEVFLNGRCWTFDARHNERRVGRVLMATSRDAADAALTSILGKNQLVKFTVWTDERRKRSGDDLKVDEEEEVLIVLSR